MPSDVIYKKDVNKLKIRSDKWLNGYKTKNKKTLKWKCKTKNSQKIKITVRLI
jgi:hypothetical protein